MTEQKNTNAMALLLKDLSKFQQRSMVAKKDAINPHYKNSYADLSSVVSAINEGSKDLNIGYYHKMEGTTLTTYLFYSDGDSYAHIESSLSIDAKSGSNLMQAIGSAITYAKRYTLQSLYGLPSDDDDGNQCEIKPPKPAKADYTLDSFEKSKFKIGKKFQENKEISAETVAKDFVSAIKKSGFEVDMDVEVAVAKFCKEQKELNEPVKDDGIPF